MHGAGANARDVALRRRHRRAHGGGGIYRRRRVLPGRVDRCSDRNRLHYPGWGVIGGAGVGEAGVGGGRHERG